MIYRTECKDEFRRSNSFASVIIPKGFNVIAWSVLHAPGYDVRATRVAYNRGLKNKTIYRHAKIKTRIKRSMNSDETSGT